VKHLLLSVFIVIAGKSFGQAKPNKPVPIITAKEAYQHVGQLVVVRDSIYSGKIINDTKTNTPRLTMFFIIKLIPRFGPLDQRFLKTYQRSKISLYSTITGTKEAPVIIVHNGTDEFSRWDLRRM
jgi:hypothetical protein